MKKEKMEKKVLILAGVLVLAVMLITSTVVFATNTATQEASTGRATTISIVGKSGDSDVSAITFPEGAPGATVSAPYNNVDTSSDSQVLSATSSEPVVRLKNTSEVTYQVWLGITTWNNGVVASQDYELVETTATSTNAVTQVLSANGSEATVDTTQTIGASAYKALYLEIELTSVAAKTSTSTLSVLGETE